MPTPLPPNETAPVLVFVGDVLEFGADVPVFVVHAPVGGVHALVFVVHALVDDVHKGVDGADKGVFDVHEGDLGVFTPVDGDGMGVARGSMSFRCLNMGGGLFETSEVGALYDTPGVFFDSGVAIPPRFFASINN